MLFIMEDVCIDVHIYVYKYKHKCNINMNIDIDICMSILGQKIRVRMTRC